MSKNGTFDFTDPNDFRATLRGLGIELLLAFGGDFKARLTQAEVHKVRLLSIWEEQARVAYVSLPRDLLFVTFAAEAGQSLVWGGVELQEGDLVVHGQGEQRHQRTYGVCHWASISVTPQHLALFARSVTGYDLVPPLTGRVLRPAGAALARLRKLHASACRLVERKPQLLGHLEILRALEHDVLYALVTCLDGRLPNGVAPSRRQASLMSRLERVLALQFDRPLRLAELCEAVGASEGTIRRCCTKFLGMSPNQYWRLRRLGMTSVVA